MRIEKDLRNTWTENSVQVQRKPNLSCVEMRSVWLPYVGVFACFKVQKNTRHVDEHVGKSWDPKGVGKKQKKMKQNQYKKKKKIWK